MCPGPPHFRWSASVGRRLRRRPKLLALARQQYQHGLSSFLNVLDAERNLYATQDALAQSRQA